MLGEIPLIPTLSDTQVNVTVVAANFVVPASIYAWRETVGNHEIVLLLKRVGIFIFGLFILQITGQGVEEALSNMKKSNFIDGDQDR